MSILIKGMEMPTSCASCPLHSEDYRGIEHCEIGWKKLPKAGEKADFCPLVPVPKHGRLIDADALIDAIQEEIDMWKDAGCDTHSYESVIDNYILDAPTIIPAEEGE